MTPPVVTLSWSTEIGRRVREGSWADQAISTTQKLEDARLRRLLAVPDGSEFEPRCRWEMTGCAGTVANLLRAYELPVAEAKLRFDDLRENWRQLRDRGADYMSGLLTLVAAVLARRRSRTAIDTCSRPSPSPSIDGSGSRSPPRRSERSDVADIPFVDTHVHFYDLRKKDFVYSWLQPEFTHPIIGDINAIKTLVYEATAFSAEGRFANVTKIVHVQAALGAPDPVGETAWLEEMAQTTGWPNAIVAHSDLKANDVQVELERHVAASPARARGSATSARATI